MHTDINIGTRLGTVEIVTRTVGRAAHGQTGVMLHWRLPAQDSTTTAPPTGRSVTLWVNDDDRSAERQLSELLRDAADALSSLDDTVTLPPDA